MQTSLLEKYQQSGLGKRADAILRKCVHCGFCLATCPTYDLLGNELDSPRGRIYQIKQVLEGTPPTKNTQLHLDRCLTCRNCETTCPSGVEYGRLVDAGREIVEQAVPRSGTDKLLRNLMRHILPFRARITPLIKLGQLFRPLLPNVLRQHVPPAQQAGVWPKPTQARKMLILDGCVQPAMTPLINAATARVLDKIGISLVTVKSAGCCGALSYHLNAQQDGSAMARANIDAWWPHIRPENKQAAEAIVMTASGCGVFVKDYGHLLQDDPLYAEKAAVVSNSCKDISEILQNEDLTKLQQSPSRYKTTNVAFHPPCTLQHGQKLHGVTESLLEKLNIKLTSFKDPHFCCGAAGTYSILQKDLSNQLLKRKIASIQKVQPDSASNIIATANIGCLLHLQAEAGSIPVVHWIQLLDPATQSD